MEYYSNENCDGTPDSIIQVFNGCTPGGVDVTITLIDDGSDVGTGEPTAEPTEEPI